MGKVSIGSNVCKDQLALLQQVTATFDLLREDEWSVAGGGSMETVDTLDGHGLLARRDERQVHEDVQLLQPIWGVNDTRM